MVTCLLVITFIVPLHCDFVSESLDTIIKLLPGRAIHAWQEKPFVYLLFMKVDVYMIFINQLFNGAPARCRMSTKIAPIYRRVKQKKNKKGKRQIHARFKRPETRRMLRAVDETKTSAHSMVNVHVAHQLFSARER